MAWGLVTAGGLAQPRPRAASRGRDAPAAGQRDRGWALILALVGLVIGAAAWAIGAHSQNYHQSFVGRRAVLVAGLAALLIGAAPTLINFFFGAGTGLH